MAASGVCGGGLEMLTGAVAGPSSSGAVSHSNGSARRRSSSWHGDTRSGWEERIVALPPARPASQSLGRRMGGPPLPDRDKGSRGRRMSSGGVRAEGRPEAVLMPQGVALQRPLSAHADVAIDRSLGADESAEGILDGGMEELPQRSGLTMLVGAHVCPHPEKVEKGGEDAYFVCSAGGGVFGVADGVSGVADDGIDPALYSRDLMALAKQAAEAEPTAAEDPRTVLEAAHARISVAGACTAVVAALDGSTGKLRIANLGDSGLRVLRNGRVCFATPILQHFFDCPFQYGSDSTDSTADAEAYEVQLQAGDCVVAGSDGLFDNMFDRDIEAVCILFNDAPEAATTTAVALATLAKKHSLDPDYESPYILEAIKEGYDVSLWQKMLGQKLTGGKKDDITVVVANIVAREEEEDADARDSATVTAGQPT